MRARTYRFLRHLPERLFHARRRAAATTLLQSDEVSSLLFVCHGNVCRSPYAAAVFAHRISETPLDVPVHVRSAGFIGPGRTPPENALAVAAERGFDLSVHRSALLTPETIRAANVIVVMSAEQATAIRARYGHERLRVLVLGDLDPLPIATRTITDPWGRGTDVFGLVFDRIDRCVGELARLVADGARSAPR